MLDYEKDQIAYWKSRRQIAIDALERNSCMGDPLSKGEHESTILWVNTWLKEQGIPDEPYKLKNFIQEE